jgi:hypothetical protein
MSITISAPDSQTPTHKIPSGMGGAFNVVVLDVAGDQARVSIIRRYSDGEVGEWHGCQRTVPVSDLTAL